MAARLTDRQKKKIIADYVEIGSYNAVAKKHGITHQTVKRVVMDDTEITQKAQQKKEENTKDMLAFMDSRKKEAQNVIDLYLSALNDPEKVKKAPIEKVATVLGIVVDKFTKLPEGVHAGKVEADPLTIAINEAVEHGLFQETGADTGVPKDETDGADL